MLLPEGVKSRALELGFDSVGIAPAEPGLHLPEYLEWVARGYHGQQAYLARPDRLERRRDLNLILPGVKSLVVVGSHYWQGQPQPAPLQFPPTSSPLQFPPEGGRSRGEPDASRGQISCYAQGTDYHHLMLPRLDALLQYVRDQAGMSTRGRAYVDTGPLLERDHALRAGLGFLGKNCHLIQPRRGSFLFLGILMLDVEIEPDEPGRMPGCGSCVRCQEACPSAAFVSPYILDSRRCISYLTTALKGSIPQEMRPLLGNHVFGCDVCQSVCPWNRFAQPAALMGDRLSIERVAPPLLELIGLSEKEFHARYGHTPIGHLGRDRFLRNVAVAIGNWGSPQAIPALERALAESGPLVRGHAAWALGKIGTNKAYEVLDRAKKTQDDVTVIREIDSALSL